MKIILFLIILFSSTVFINGQIRSAGEPGLYSCEENAARFDSLIDVLKSNNEILFVVARLGTKESSRELNRRRLHNVRTYFTVNRQFDSKRFVFAEGDRVSGLGRIEFYMGSNLQITPLVKRNSDICVDCCDFDDPRYYGMGKIDKPKRRNK